MSSRTIMLLDFLLVYLLPGISLFTIVGFSILKLTGVIDLNWLWVFVPLVYFPIAIFLAWGCAVAREVYLDVKEDNDLG